MRTQGHRAGHPARCGGGVAAAVRHIARAVAAAALAACGVASAADSGLPEGPGANVVYSKCQTCHSLQYVVDAKGLLPAQWNAVLASMRDYGLQIDDAQAKQVLQYLSTYLGPNPPPAAAAGTSGASGTSATSATAGASAAAGTVDGSKVYADNCASCHGAAGHGQAGYYPPLAGNPDLAKDLLPVLVVLNGMSGPIEVNGQTLDNSMPPLGYLSNAEIAAVVNFVRGLNPGQPKPVAPETVAERRQQSMTPTEVHAYRATLK